MIQVGATSWTFPLSGTLTNWANDPKKVWLPEELLMVPETGIEPVTFALEGRCSSTELLGQWSQKSISRKEQKSKDSIQKNSRVLIENLIVYVRITLYIQNHYFLIWYSFVQDLGIYLLSHVNPRSTIDVTKLNCCVRKGNRCTPRTIDTKILKKNIISKNLHKRNNVLWSNKAVIDRITTPLFVSNILPDYIHTNILSSRSQKNKE